MKPCWSVSDRPTVSTTKQSMTVWSGPMTRRRSTLFRDPVPGYDGRPIGISDVLELYDADGSEFYYCDRVGFRQIEFAPRQEMELCP
ncbi:YodL domain-containing protein [Dysosmobacter sp.]|uniref:YodL domain-containing protein n=1 Tax=Dysosmobacter sp. TaxID=2591382 RepID=UPI003AB16936